MEVWFTLPETNSSPLKIGHHKRKGSSSNHPFSGAMLALGRVDDFPFQLDFTQQQYQSDISVNVNLSTLRLPQKC